MERSAALFATPVFTFVPVEQHETMRAYLYEDILEMSKGETSLEISNRGGGWHSETDLHAKPAFNCIVHPILKLMTMVFEVSGYKVGSAPVMTQMWANVNPMGAWNEAHCHGASLWSGVYYVATPAMCGNLVFHDTRPKMRTDVTFNVPEFKPSMWREEMLHKPCAGELVVFPSWLEHSVEKNLSADPRVSLSFNIIQRVEPQ